MTASPLPAIDRPAVRLALGLLDGLALAFAVAIAAGLATLGLFDRDASAPMLLGVLAPALGLAALTTGRRNRAVLAASGVANVLMLPFARYWADSVREDAGLFAAWLVLAVVVVPLANVWLAATRWSALRAARDAT